jgi:hypothetical protein
MVPEGGLEPPQGYPYRILSPARLPFHHSGTIGILSRHRLAGHRTVYSGSARHRHNNFDYSSQILGSFQGLISSDRPKRFFIACNS